MTGQKKVGADKTGQDEKMISSLEKNPQLMTCGLIMPIASNEGGTAEHWRQVREIITSAINSLNLKVQMVSESEAVNVIHKNIVQNIFANEIVVCDVSSRNPNVMFELGMRLAFDKPVVIIKDKDTPFSFDIGSIQHIEYPRSLNYIEILSFQDELLKKIKFTMSEAEAARNGAGKYSPFLSNYSITEVAEIRTNKIGKEEFLVEKLDELASAIRRLEGIGSRNQPMVFANDENYNVAPQPSIMTDKYNGIVNKIINLLTNAAIKDGGDVFNNIPAFCSSFFDRNYPNMSMVLKDDITSTVIDLCKTKNS